MTRAGTVIPFLSQNLRLVMPGCFSYTNLQRISSIDNPESVFIAEVIVATLCLRASYWFLTKKIRSKGLFLCVIEEDADADPPPTVEELSGNLGFAW